MDGIAKMILSEVTRIQTDKNTCFIPVWILALNL